MNDILLIHHFFFDHSINFLIFFIHSHRNFLSISGSLFENDTIIRYFLQEEIPMTIDRLVLAFAGSFILISLLLSVIHSHNWLWFTAFVGANLIQASFTGFCPLAKVLKLLGVKEGAAFK
jgi:hypothetical protein